MDLLLKEEELKHYNQTLFAKAGLKTFADFFLQNQSPEQILFLKKKINEDAPNNAVLLNLIDFFLLPLPKNPSEKTVKEHYHGTITKLSKITNECTRHGVKKIKPGSTIFIHSLTEQLFKVLSKSQQHKEFFINTLTHVPFNYGIKLKEALKNQNTRSFYDLEIEEAIASSDTCFFGASAVTKKGGAIVRTGSKLCSYLAKQHNIPVYVVAHTWTHHKKHNPEQLLSIKHNNTKVYEALTKEAITGYITEHGIIKPQHFLSEIF